ncbi:6136_t:CDS:2 [Cetraspora pellucida]|uniref:6136_t:CDS:1 n=1 Tax=Cetraspora pellucida TaxID=1433469 RepID=A0ACA9K9Y7_9GLOM|nr:6136_t:CDS:2 [Cetraspora pellucida]
MSKSIKLCNISEYESFIDKFDTFLLDCDGVLWKGGDTVPGKKLLFVTNNSSRSRADYVEKFKKLDIEAYEDEIFSSSYASAYYLKNVLKFPKEKKIYIIGESGIADELASEGIRHCGLSDSDQQFKPEDIVPDPEVFRLFIYSATSECIPSSGFISPGAGAIAAPLITALNKKPDGIMGKPNKPMMDCIAQKFKLNLERTCMIGDRLETDIQFGNNNGVTTLLVLTGIAAEKDILVDNAPIIPDYYISSFGDFAKLC